MHIMHVVGARPNFMKVAPVIRALAEADVPQTLVHTGQHYDKNMSEIFFHQLGIPKPDVNLGIASRSHATQTAEIMLAFEPLLLDNPPDWVLVYGDINSTLAAAMVAAKLGVRVAHVEAGLRSRDRTMPEELNRLVTDQLSDRLFTPSKDGNENLLAEGIAPAKIELVGNVMIDTLIRLLPYAEAIAFDALPKQFMLVTLHRPSNVDDGPFLSQIIQTLTAISDDIPIVFPMHPRTRQQLKNFDIVLPAAPGLHIWEPVGYLEFLSLQKRAHVVLTDSGGIQEETTYLNVPCLTLRENTERPVTVSIGSNQLLGRDLDALRIAVMQILRGDAKRGERPPLWDGQAGQRISQSLLTTV